jgi:hypothetical protein
MSTVRTVLSAAAVLYKSLHPESIIQIPYWKLIHRQSVLTCSGSPPVLQESGS